MTISLSDAGKRFNRDWIFRHFTYTFETGNAYAITGPNGSGKSTLLQVISGGMMINEGKMQWAITGNELANEQIYQHVSICAPYLEVIEEMTLTEFMNFHQGFKPWLPGLSAKEIISIIGLEKAVHKQIRYYSSGMKQRVKLAQCILSDTMIVLLDEPCTNLDTAGIDLYHSLINKYCKHRLVAVSSNDETEYKFCTHLININDYKRH
ncbi:MAG TPA: ATP-binding cassette domain-containing protein [Chitinophagaceae bacterium]|nr:ATP-binding cassette domain-containing protein [Chitinophagaceae bacterium]HQV85738.1 ATP-binding cassette domain-containing protein [Chitinophagaceae bacterium]HQZ73525.1 ATP-binding cassette domain-containing protein [Chitinophagaceae bacterium]